MKERAEPGHSQPALSAGRYSECIASESISGKMTFEQRCNLMREGTRQDLGDSIPREAASAKTLELALAQAI